MIGGDQHPIEEEEKNERSSSPQLNAGAVPPGEFISFDSIQRQTSVEEQLKRVDSKFINIAQVIKSLPVVVKEIELLARQSSLSCPVYCTSEQCKTLLLSRGVDKDNG